MPEKNIIASEADAWKMLSTWVEGGELPALVFKDWPVLRIKVNGEGYNSSLNSNQMAALIEFKVTVGRTYAMVAHGAYDMRRLQEDEEEQLDFNTHVRQGSSIFETDLTPVVQALSSAVAAYPGGALAAGLILGLAFVARPVILKHYEVRAKEIDSEERAGLLSLTLTTEENKKYDIYEKGMEKLVKMFPQIQQALPDARNAFWKLASASADADKLTVAGIAFSQDDLGILSARRSRRRSSAREITRKFQVAGITKDELVYRVKLEATGLALTATYRRPQMTEGRIRKLFRCMADSMPIEATLEIRTIDKAQVSALMLRFRVIEPTPST